MSSNAVFAALLVACTQAVQLASPQAQTYAWNPWSGPGGYVSQNTGSPGTMVDEQHSKLPQPQEQVVQPQAPGQVMPPPPSAMVPPVPAASGAGAENFPSLDMGKSRTEANAAQQLQHSDTMWPQTDDPSRRYVTNNVIQQTAPAPEYQMAPSAPGQMFLAPGQEMAPSGQFLRAPDGTVWAPPPNGR